LKIAPIQTRQHLHLWSGAPTKILLYDPIIYINREETSFATPLFRKAYFRRVSDNILLYI
jgi:hypothetical protein